MDEIIDWEQRNRTLPNHADTTELIDLTQRAQVLKDLALALLNEVQTLGDEHAMNLGGAIDLHDEVRRFEIELINRALKKTGGHQMRAAVLLNVKVTTLNSKIKRYNISVVDQTFPFPPGLPVIEELRNRA